MPQPHPFSMLPSIPILPMRPSHTPFQCFLPFRCFLCASITPHTALLQYPDSNITRDWGHTTCHLALQLHSHPTSHADR
jgi:hypothetical protein